MLECYVLGLEQWYLSQKYPLGTGFGTNEKAMLLAVTMAYILFCREISYKGSN